MKITVELTGEGEVGRKVVVEDPTVQFSEEALRAALRVIDETFIIRPSDEPELHHIGTKIIGFQPTLPDDDEEDDDAEPE